MGPMPIKWQQEPRYVPWCSQDLHNLIMSLPDIQDGVGHWIRKLEEEILGKKMTLGDVKALLGKILGAEKMLEAMQGARLNLDDMKATRVDGVPFDAYRNRVWGTLREIFPA
ncbi:hypothetical protein AAFF_G00192470 [Aldrovandia affinis]|uniref:Uncharacterized protein n=1 Tax=Aldrovandia affinis TaxID=143900 RepID=A0AAD7W5K4_9TELE|nr:hypothetical protein AAFF_G00192470 [Aldrovandia affinis]